MNLSTSFYSFLGAHICRFSHHRWRN